MGGGGRDVIYPNWDSGNEARSNEDAGIRNTITLGADGDFIFVLDYSPPNLASVDRVTDFDPDEDKVWVVAVGGDNSPDDWDWVQGSGANSDHTYLGLREGGSGPKYVLLILENVDANDLSLDNFTEDHLWDSPVASSANKCSQDCDEDSVWGRNLAHRSGRAVVMYTRGRRRELTMSRTNRQVTAVKERGLGGPRSAQ